MNVEKEILALRADFNDEKRRAREERAARYCVCGGREADHQHGGEGTRTAGLVRLPGAEWHRPEQMTVEMILAANINRLSLYVRHRKNCKYEQAYADQEAIRGRLIPDPELCDCGLRFVRDAMRMLHEVYEGKARWEAAEGEPNAQPPVSVGATDRGLVVADLRQFLLDEAKEILVPRSLLDNALAVLLQSRLGEAADGGQLTKAAAVGVSASSADSSRISPSNRLV